MGEIDLVERYHQKVLQKQKRWINRKIFSGMGIIAPILTVLSLPVIETSQEVPIEKNRSGKVYLRIKSPKFRIPLFSAILSSFNNSWAVKKASPAAVCLSSRGIPYREHKRSREYSPLLTWQGIWWNPNSSLIARFAVSNMGFFNFFKPTAAPAFSSMATSKPAWWATSTELPISVNTFLKKSAREVYSVALMMP